MSGAEKRTEDTGTRIERRGENNIKKNDMAGEMKGKMQGRGGEEEEEETEELLGGNYRRNEEMTTYISCK